MNVIYVLLITVFTAIISYLLVKKKRDKLNKYLIIKSILWVEACIFLIMYFATRIHEFKMAWCVFLFIASIFSLVPENSKK